MDQSLIPVFQANDQQLLCNARDLHEFLEVGRDFSNWIKDRIKKYGFVEGEDFLTIDMTPGEGHKTASQNREAQESQSYEDEEAHQNWRALESITYAENFGQQGRIEYHLTIQMAKELAMIENNAMGRRVRRYFIQRERQAIELLQQQADSVRPLEEVRAEIGDTPKFRYLLILQEQSRSCARQLDQAQGSHERYTLHCQLRQINNVIGIPTQPLVKQDEVGKLSSSTSATHKLEHSHG
ncbi:antA/AntB antirepressor family protein [Vreelandella titanicae]|uniref:antA/AntB antirepressor family protein n=1 Tax=Vreelandella titanicae TaxID=664683 RepID=UPI003BAEDBFE